MSESPDAFEGLIADFAHTPERLREKLFAAYDALDTEVHRDGSRHNAGEMIDVYVRQKDELLRVYFERRADTWVQATITNGRGRDTSFNYAFLFGQEHASMNGESNVFDMQGGSLRRVSASMPSEELTSTEIMLLMTGIIEDTTERILSGKATANVIDG